MFLTCKFVCRTFLFSPALSDLHCLLDLHLEDDERKQWLAHRASADGCLEDIPVNSLFRSIFLAIVCEVAVVALSVAVRGHFRLEIKHG